LHLSGPSNHPRMCHKSQKRWAFSQVAAVTWSRWRASVGPCEAVEPRAASDPTHPTPVESDATVWVAVTLRAFEEGSGREYRTVQVDQLGKVGITRDQRGDVGHSGKGHQELVFRVSRLAAAPSGRDRGSHQHVGVGDSSRRHLWGRGRASSRPHRLDLVHRQRHGRLVVEVRAFATRVMSARKSALAASSSPAPRYLSIVQRPCRPAQRSPRARLVRALRYVPGAEVMSWSRGAPTNPPS